MAQAIKPFPDNALILYPLKAPENLWFSGVFRGYKMRIFARNGLIKVFPDQNYVLFVPCTSIKTHFADQNCHLLTIYITHFLK